MRAAVILGGPVVLIAILIVAVSRSSAVPPTVRPVGNDPTLVALASTPHLATDCPWLARAMAGHDTPDHLARLVVQRMTLAEKLGEIALTAVGPYENVNKGVSRLCIPPLTLQDGPEGLAFGDTGVTQLPAPLALASTFDPRLALDYGEVIGEEAAGQGFDVAQGPTLDLLRVPENGRAFETYGEDPLLASVMGVADVRGIQSRKVMANAKEYVAYSQETDRGDLDAVVPARALDELYLRPFKAVVTQSHVASIMCAYPRLAGIFQCQDGPLLGRLGTWGFTGFVRSDLGAVHDPEAAVAAGTALIKPDPTSELTAAVQRRSLPISDINGAVQRILSTMFAYGVVGRVPIGSPDDRVETPQHADVARTVAERGAVLLRNQRGVLPLKTDRDRSVAVIGADASGDPVVTGFGSSRVRPPFVSTPLAAIRRRAGSATKVTFASGGSTTGPLPPIPSSVLTPSSGQGTGLTFTLVRAGSSLETVQSVEPSVDAFVRPYSGGISLLHRARPLAPVEQRDIRRGVESLPDEMHPLDEHSLGPSIGRRPTRSIVVLPPGWSDASAKWTGTLTPPSTGRYTFSLQGSGASTLYLDGQPVVNDDLSHVLGRWSQSVTLTAQVPVSIEVDWNLFGTSNSGGLPTVVASGLTLGWRYVSTDIAAAVAAARKADVAVVMAGDYNAESFDRPSLSLPGDENALISAVAAANPRTVVVLNTGGPVLMPWINQVEGVVEDWYAGEEDGDAIAALLYGDVDPSGRLPVTFPVSEAQSAINTPQQWPGIDLVSTYSGDLEVGYRWNHATGIAPLFPFGAGLSYTRFTLSGLSVRRSRGGVEVSVRVANVGNRQGTAVPQVYVTDPPAAGEPPAQLAAFDSVTLPAHVSRVVTMTVPRTSFEADLGNRSTEVSGDYTISVGQNSASLPLHVTIPTPG